MNTIQQYYLYSIFAMTAYLSILFTILKKCTQKMAWIIPFESYEQRNRMRIVRKHLRDVMNPFDLSDHL